MTKKEKVIKGLECCCLPMTYVCKNICPYGEELYDPGDGDGYGYANCMAAMLPDALTLLKEQEQIINELEEKLRLLEYGDQDVLQNGMMPAT